MKIKNVRDIENHMVINDADAYEFNAILDVPSLDWPDDHEYLCELQVQTKFDQLFED